MNVNGLLNLRPTTLLLKNTYSVSIHVINKRKDIIDDYKIYKKRKNTLGTKYAMIFSLASDRAWACFVIVMTKDNRGDCDMRCLQKLL